MATYKVIYNGIDGQVVRKFDSLVEVQAYVKARWGGVDYIDGPQEFHTDYGLYSLLGCALSDLGARRGPRGTDDYWNWDWKEVGDAE